MVLDARIARLCLAVALVAAATGCLSTKPKKQSELMKSSRNVKYAYTAEELRLLMRDAVGPVTGRIEETADRILAEATDPKIRRAALVWKLEAMPAYREALFRTDPIGAVLDSYALTLQMEDFYDEGPGKDVFGPWQQSAVLALRELEAKHHEMIDGIVESGDPSEAIELVTDWAHANPIATSIASRPSILNMVGTIKRRSGTGGLASGIGVTVDDMVRRVEVYSDQIPRQARWQVELYTMELIKELELDRTLAELPEMIDGIDRVATSIEHLDDRIDTELEQILIDIERQRLETLGFTTEQMDKVLAFIRSERVAVLADVERERIATIEDVRGEVRYLVAALTAERDAAMVDADDLADRHLSTTLTTVEDIVDRVLIKVTVVMTIFLALGALLAFLFARSLRRTA